MGLSLKYFKTEIYLNFHFGKITLATTRRVTGVCETEAGTPFRRETRLSSANR